MNVTVGNTLFKKKASHQVIYESVLSKPQVDYCLVRRNQRNLLKDMLYLVKSISPSISLKTCVFKIKKMIGTGRKFVPRKASWRQCKE